MRIRANGGIIGPQSNRGNFTSTGDSGLLTSITNVYICDSNYNDLDDTVMSTSGGYIRLTGVGFSSDCSLYVNGVYISFTQIISSNEITAVIPANGNGTYSLTLFNSSGSGAIWAAGLTFSGFPSWTTDTYSNSSAVVSTQLLVTGDGTLTYSLQDGSTLPDGVTLSSSGLLSGTVTGITTSTVYTFTVLVDDAQLQTTQQLITLSVLLNDQYFNSTVLLLHGDGTDGSNNNNTFKDSSTNNFAITRTGTPTQGTFTPFSQTGWSGYFNGSSNIANTTSNAFTFGTGDFTVEYWVNYSVINATYNALCGNGTGASGFGIGLANAGGQLYITTSTNGYPSTGTGLVVNQWYHVAFVRISGTVKYYLNGVLNYTGSIPTNITETAFAIGQKIGGTFPSTAYVSNLRVVKGTGIYTAAFTPPTIPLTAVTNTSLLTLQNNQFKDNSSNNFAFTATGTPSIQAFSPFAPAAAYSTATVGGSGYFNGSTDYLTTPINAALTFGSGAGVSAMTAEAWFYTSAAASTDQTVISQYASGSSGWSIRLLTSLMRVALTGDTTLITGTTTLRANTWYHAALSGSAGSWKLFLNGVQEGATQTASVTMGDGAPIQIGRLSNVSYFNGYISNARVLKGTALYTTAFTPPTAPLTAVANTSLLLNATNAAIFDQTAKNDLVTVGTSAVSNTQSKFGGKSMFFNGTTDYLTAINTPNLQLGTGNFTIEAWVYLTTASTSRGLVSKGPVAGTTGWECKFNSANFFRFEWTASSLVGVTTIPITTWTHVAVVRSGSATGNVKLYVNGTLYATSNVAVTDNFTQTDPLRIGIDRVGTGFFPGYVDDLRITKYARYTANFTPPTSTFLDQ